MTVDEKTYELGEGNYYDKEFDKNKIIIGNTNNTDMNHVEGWKHRLLGNYKKTSTFTIDRKGNVYQHFNPAYYSDFIGDKGVDKKAITISLENQGWLLKDILRDKYYDWVGNPYKRRVKVIEKRWRGQTYWDPYTPKQYKATLELVEYLCNEYDIPKKAIGHNTQLDNIQSFVGVSYRSNYYKERTDLSPAWDCKKLKNKLEK
jgi:N-acetyl-anhydromuramyl-L-alanine amidase AmpD